MDLIIRGGEVVDGSGGPRRRADIGVTDGRVVAVGQIDDAGHKVIDAGGRIVAPGFIDVHTHLDVQGFWDSTLGPSPLHGITSVIGGNCGFTVAPLNADSTDYLMRLLARVEGMPLESLRHGVPWDWQTTAQYFARLEGTLAVNAGFKVGHSTLRRVVMAEQANERAATPAEIERMCSLLRDGLSAGALGFSSTWSPTHNDDGGRPVPSRFAEREELVALAAVCSEFDGTSLEFLPGLPTATFSDEANDVMIEMSVAARRPLNWNVILVDASNLERAMKQLEVSDRARERGGKIVGLTMPITSPGRFTFLSGFILDNIEGWGPVMTLPRDEKLSVLRQPDARAHLFELSQRPGPMRHLGDWGAKVITETHSVATRRYEGRLVAEIASEERKQPFDALLDIVCADDLRTTFATKGSRATTDDWRARLAVWRDPRAVIGGSDAGAHLDMASFFNYPTVMLEQAVREQHLLPLEEAIHLLTDVQARLYGLVGRGRLVEGAQADIVIFDEDTIGSDRVRTRFDLPEGCGRLYATGRGIDHVIVNGAEIVANGEFTGARPGTLLRSGRDTRSPDLGFRAT